MQTYLLLFVEGDNDMPEPVVEGTLLRTVGAEADSWVDKYAGGTGA